MTKWKHHLGRADIRRSGSGIDHALLAASVVAASACAVDEYDELGVELGAVGDTVVVDIRHEALDASDDLIWRSESGQVHYWTLVGEAPWGDARMYQAVGSHWRLAGVGDVTGDGRDDIVWQRSDGLVHYWPVAHGRRLGGVDVRRPASGWNVRGVGDVTGDGTADIVLQHDSGQVHYWPMVDGARVGGRDIHTPVGEAWSLRGVGDVDGDGTEDLVWRHANGQAHYWQIRGGQRVRGRHIGAPVDRSWRLVGVGTMNNDETADLVWQHDTGRIRSWRLRAGNRVSAKDISGSSPAGSELVGVGNVSPGSGVEPVSQVEISVVRGAAGCEYRLEYNDPADRPDWALHQIGGGHGPLHEYVDPDCRVPAFVADETTSADHFEQQSAYYWLFEARAYAVETVWAPYHHALATDRLDASIVTASEFTTFACFPLDAATSDGCMRAWPHEGPRIYFEEGRMSPWLVAHEFGHYAAGYVFGHMDVLAIGGFDPANCHHSAFQEGVAEVFAQLFLHDRAGEAKMRASAHATASGVWTGNCEANPYATRAPLVAAVTQALVGNPDDPALQVAWTGAAEANAAVADAFAFALFVQRSHDIGTLARDMVARLLTTQPLRAAALTRIFRAHGFAMDLGERCWNDGNCQSGRCDTTSYGGYCIPNDREGEPGDYCTHNHHCEHDSCVGLTPARAGTCETVASTIGSECVTNAGCDGYRTSRCDQTISPRKCIPDDGKGRRGEYCTHNHQCDGSRGLVCRVRSGPAPQPGTCET